MMDKTSKMWKNVSMTGGDMKGDALSFHFEANLVDEKTNSLKQLNTYFNDMHHMSEVKRKQDPVLKNLDSLLTPPPIDTVAVQ